MASSFIEKAFEDVGCPSFCERIQETSCHAKLISLFYTSFRGDNASIAGDEFTISSDSITSAIAIPNHGEICFKGMDLDIENYKIFLKSHYKDAPKHVFHFRKLLARYAPLIKMSMRYLICEGRFSRIY